ncbi:hypothetical protein E0F15_12345 [Frankia sp. B2]|nr:hypothetical protein E0F15_12345 [Frankia sp. B2]
MLGSGVFRRVRGSVSADCAATGSSVCPPRPPKASGRPPRHGPGSPPGHANRRQAIIQPVGKTTDRSTTAGPEGPTS